MTIIITKYEDSANNNIVFDSSKFDYSYDADAFPADFVDDADNILLEAGDVYKIIQQSDTTDSMGRVTDVTETYFYAYGIIQDITIKDRQIADMGLAIAGNAKAFFKPYYTITSAGAETNNYIKEGDIVLEGTRYWRIEKIIGERTFSNQVGFISVVLKSINNEPSS